MPARVCAILTCKHVIMAGTYCDGCKRAIRLLEGKTHKELYKELASLTLRAERVKKALGLWI